MHSGPHVLPIPIGSVVGIRHITIASHPTDQSEDVFIAKNRKRSRGPDGIEVHFTRGNLISFHHADISDLEREYRDDHSMDQRTSPRDDGDD